MMWERYILLPFVFATSISLAVTYLTIQIYRQLGIVDRSTTKDHPKNIHSGAIPRGGGIPIFIATTLTVLAFLPSSSTIVAILSGAAILLILGILDDLFNISPYLRLVGGLLAAMLVVFFGVSIEYISNPLGGPPISFESMQWIATIGSILWITWSMNFVNMGAKGLDGQLPGVVIIAAMVLGIVSTRFIPDPQAYDAIFLAVSVLGSFLGLLFFNIYPQKILPGWGAGSLAGYLLAVISMLAGAKLATALIVLGIPLMDVIYAIIRRIRNGKSPVWGDAEHLHHKLLALGMSKRQVAVIYWGFSLVLGLVALKLNSQMKIYTILLIAIVVGGVLLWINSYLSQKSRE
ncbi:MAG: undecaprenyl/decaprenyl-phosphate alpha-N-acetylglucosaminyl 1-phosphate transferase [Candidatus Moraniibacteriota bacterium]|nr:MAG: undecaprenyl/decaprenyl-phosphate alpha-N-acetylglucosaminyl 1-phosphate transferase [Candidatus Moranbacteria bacterium]